MLLYESAVSGNCYKVRLLFAQLGIEYERRLTLADLALYAYTHVAPESGFDLDRYEAIPAWLARVASQPGHVPIDA